MLKKLSYPFALFLALGAVVSVPSETLAQSAPSKTTSPDASAKRAPAAKASVKVAVASVTLGDECSNDAATPAANTESVPAAKLSAPAAGRAASVADVEPSMGASRQPCVQSAIVLKVTSQSKSKQVIEIAKVELLDAQGKVLGSMTARNPMQWKASKRNASYQPWDLTVARGKSVQARWWLSAPPVNAAGRANAAGGYRVNVTVTVNGQETSVTGNVNELRVVSPPMNFDPPMAT
jgi:hypothetical protein